MHVTHDDANIVIDVQNNFCPALPPFLGRMKKTQNVNEIAFDRIDQHVGQRRQYEFARSRLLSGPHKIEDAI
jgi:hypothetical protein